MNRPAVVTPLSIPDAGPLFEGHFPGRAILPGIVLLNLALGTGSPGEAAGVTEGSEEAALAAIDMLRFRRLVLPGERIEVHWSGGGAPGRASLFVRRGEERIAEAVVRLAPAVSPMTASLPPADRDEEPQEGAAAAGLLPHGPPACFIETVRSVSGAGIVCAARVPAAHHLASRGPVPALVAIEMAAQAAGVFEARRRPRPIAGIAPGAAVTVPGTAGTEPGPRLGYLVGARGVRFARATLAQEAACTASVRLVGMAGPLTSYDFEVTCEGAPLAAGRVSTWLTATGS
jgi:3-hydroxyacyl-[acyl-carrier-protein] dehydratase